eukprot:gene625-3935_t
MDDESTQSRSSSLSDPLRELESRLDALLERNDRQQKQSRKRMEILTVLDRIKTFKDDSPQHLKDNNRNQQFCSQSTRSRIPVLSNEVKHMQVEVQQAMLEIKGQLHQAVSSPQPISHKSHCHPQKSASERENQSQATPYINKKDYSSIDENDFDDTSHITESTQFQEDAEDIETANLSGHQREGVFQTDSSELSISLHQPQNGSYKAPNTVHRLLGKELADERRRRIRVEQEVALLQEQIAVEEDRVKHAHGQLATVMSTVSRLEDILNRSTQKNKSLVEIVNQRADQVEQAEKKEGEYQNKIQQLERELRSQSAQFQSQAKVIMSLKDEIKRVQLQEMERARDLELKFISLKNQSDMHKRALHQANKTVQTLQAKFSEQQENFQKQTEGLVSLHGPEVQNLLKQRENELQLHFNQWYDMKQKEIDEIKSQYQALDGKHHAAIHYDQERINEMMSRLKLSQDQIEDLQNKLTVTQNEASENTRLMSEMAAVIDQQRKHLKQQSVRIKTQTQELCLLKKKLDGVQRERKEDENSFKKQQDEIKELEAKLSAHMSVIDGLRKERELWSQELANQGASLAAERGTLEAKLRQNEEKSQETESQNRKLQEALCIKEKIIKDQTEELKTLRQRLADSERELSRTCEQHREREADLQDRLEAERELSQQLQADLEIVSEKKSQLREKISELTSENDSVRRENTRLKTSWEDTGMKLGQLELEVQSMEQSSRRRVEEAIRGREEAEKKVLQQTQEFEGIKSAYNKQIQRLKKQHEEILQALDTTRIELEQANATIQQQEDKIKAVQDENWRWKRAQEQKIIRLQTLIHELSIPNSDDMENPPVLNASS